MKLSISLTAALFAGLLSTGANAATDTVTINLSGTLTRPPCTLTSSKTLTANFGSLRYDQVADAALIYGGQARILRVVQDGNRAMSIGRVTDTNTLEKPDRHATAAA